MSFEQQSIESIDSADLNDEPQQQFNITDFVQHCRKVDEVANQLTNVRDELDRIIKTNDQEMQKMAHMSISHLYESSIRLKQEPTVLYIVCATEMQTVWSDRLNKFGVKYSFVSIDHQDEQPEGTLIL